MNADYEQLHADINLLITRIKTVFWDLADQHGLTRVQLSTLLSIEKKGELAMGQVAGELHCDASNITGVVDRLVAQGFITRQESASDRRTKTLALTAKGKKTVQLTKVAMAKRLHYANLTQAEKDTLHVIIAKVCAAQ